MTYEKRHGWEHRAFRVVELAGACAEELRRLGHRLAGRPYRRPEFTDAR